MTTNTPILEITNLHYQYAQGEHNQRTILNGVNLTLQSGELLTLLGRNGAGKSTLLNCIAGLSPAKCGQIRLNSIKLEQLSHKQIAQQIAYVSQLSPQTYQYTVRDYVVLGRAAHLGLFDKPTAQDFDLVDQALNRLDILPLTNHIYMHLSGGEKQLVNIARTLVQQPRLILFDEPTSALDYGNVFKILQLIKTLSEQGFSIIVTTHNPEHAILLDSRVAILTQQGQLQVGDVEQIITEPNLQALYQLDLSLIHVAELQRNICAIKHL